MSVDPQADSGKLYTVGEAAERLNTRVRFVRRLVAERRIAFIRLGRHVRIAEQDIAAFLAAGRVEPMTAGSVRGNTRSVA
jgi:excisionase family DNA binding protein